MSATTLFGVCVQMKYFYPHHPQPHWPQVVGSETRFICMGVSTSLSCLHKSGQGKLHHPLHIIHVARCQGHQYYTILYYYTIQGHLRTLATHPFDPDTLPTVTADDLICPLQRITVFLSTSNCISLNLSKVEHHVITWFVGSFHVFPLRTNL